MKWGNIPKSFPYPNNPNKAFRIIEGEAPEDVFLEEGKGTFTTDKDLDIEEFTKDMKKKKMPVTDKKMKDKIQNRVE